MDVKTTPLISIHKELGAKIGEFAGFHMPIFFSGIIDEHLWVRRHSGLFDVSHMGEIELRGRRALEFLSFITSNDPSLLKEHQAQYSTILNENGGIVDDILVYRLEDRFILVVNAVNTGKDYEHLLQFLFKEGVEVRNISEEIAQIALQGPQSEEILGKIVDIDLNKLLYYHSAWTRIMGFKVLISRTGYTGEDGFEIYSEASVIEKIYRRILEFKEVKPVGLGARDTLRLEAGYCLYGNDINDDVTPIEAGLLWILKLNKDNFLGKNRLLKQREEGVARKRIGFLTRSSRAIPRPHQDILVNEKKVGEITSGSISPMLKRGIGMGYVETGYSNPGTEIDVSIRNRREEAEIVKLPFYKGTVKR